MTDVTRGGSAEALDFPSPELFEDPYPFFERARTTCPVARSAQSDEFLVFRHEDIAHVLRHPEIFSEELPAGTPLDRGDHTLIGETGPPKHTGMRALASRPLTPRRLREYAPRIQAIADRLIDGFVERGEVELMHELALPLPALLMCELMDLPTEGPEWDLVAGQWGGTLAGAGGMNTGYWPTLGSYFEEKLRERLDGTGDDMLSELVRLHRERDGEIDLDYLTVIAAELMVGGAGTTALMIVNALWLLLENPDQLALVRGNRDLVVPALEESLRVEGVVQERHRFTSQDTVLGGVEIPAGTYVRLVLASGSRDAAVFDDPDRFDVERPRGKLKEHFGFGYGIHFCLGAPLARLEGQIAIERLFDRCGTIELAPGRNDFAHLPNEHFRSLRELHVVFDAA